MRRAAGYVGLVVAALAVGAVAIRAPRGKGPTSASASPAPPASVTATRWYKGASQAKQKL